MDSIFKEILDHFSDEDLAEIVIATEKNQFIIALHLEGYNSVELEPQKTIEDGLNILLEYVKENY